MAAEELALAIQTNPAQSIAVYPFRNQMALRIKNNETCELARELAELTDDTMTGAITIALRENETREADLPSSPSPCARMR